MCRAFFGGGASLTPATQQHPISPLVFYSHQCSHMVDGVLVQGKESPVPQATTGPMWPCHDTPVECSTTYFFHPLTPTHTSAPTPCRSPGDPADPANVARALNLVLGSDYVREELAVNGELHTNQHFLIYQQMEEWIKLMCHMVEPKTHPIRLGHSRSSSLPPNY